MHKWTRGGIVLLILTATLFAFLLAAPDVTARESFDRVEARKGYGRLVLDGRDVVSDTLFYEGTLYVPVRTLQKETGKSLVWDPASRTAQLYAGETPPKLPKDPAETITASSTQTRPDAKSYPLGDRVLQGKTKIPVLMYHHLDDNYQSAPGAVMPFSRFAEHLEALKKAGFETISFEELWLSAYGKFTLPAKPVILTFDDGYRSNYDLAFPLLKKHGFKANINVVSSSRGKTPGSIPHFTWEEARKMQDSGFIEIGCHTNNLHGNGVVKNKGENTGAFLERIRKDLTLSKNSILENTGTTPLVFCYPFGKFSPETQKLVVELGYGYQLSVKPGVITEKTKRHEIPRITANANMTGAQLIQTIGKY